MEMYRHGDVLLIRRPDESPEQTASEANEIVVAEGEVTGHAHRVRGIGARLRRLEHAEREGVIRLDVPAGGVIRHEEHATITLPPGVYEVRHQRTMTQQGIWERVRD